MNGGIEMGDTERPTRMKATARRDADGTYKHTVQVREHQLTVDEPVEKGGDDTAPSPQELLAVSLASCTAITMEMYAARKGWELGPVEVDVQYKGAERGCPTKFELVLRLPDDLPEEQARAPARDRRQVPRPPRARRRGHVRRAHRARAARAALVGPGSR